jgi:hypothetical protein
MQTLVEWNIQKKSPQQDVKNSTINNHLGHTWYGLTYNLFHWSFLQARVNHSYVF